MSSLTTENGIVHYEVHGRGKPVILLHGWLESWGLWQDTMAYLGQHYRTYALDFWGFGESGNKNGTYSMDDFVKLVDQFMEHLGIVEAPLIGHSMGGTVGLAVAMAYPERVTNVTVIGSPINGNSLAPLLKLAGLRPIAMLVHNMMWALKLGIRISAPVITKDRRWPDMIIKDLSKTTVESFLISIATLRQTNLTQDLGKIDIPIMGIYGKKDVIVSPHQWKPLQAGAPQSRIEWLQDAGHFPMLDQPTEFKRTLLDFLDSTSN